MKIKQGKCTFRLLLMNNEELFLQEMSTNRKQSSREEHFTKEFSHRSDHFETFLHEFIFLNILLLTPHKRKTLLDRLNHQ